MLDRAVLLAIWQVSRLLEELTLAGESERET